jgi:hypothetical protein
VRHGLKPLRRSYGNNKSTKAAIERRDPKPPRIKPVAIRSLSEPNFGLGRAFIEKKSARNPRGHIIGDKRPR